MDQLPFQKFLALVEFDQQINKELEEQRSLETALQKLEQRIQEHKTLFEVHKQGRHQARKEVDAKELEMKELDHQLKHAQQRLDTATDTKEYQSLKKEIEHIKKQQHDFEEFLITAWSAVEAAERSYKKAEEEGGQALDTVQKEMEIIQQKIAEKKQKVAQHEDARAEKINEIPEQWRELYERMRYRVTNPVIPVINGSCSACFFQISAQDMSRLRNRALLQCKQCYRFLYSKEAMQA